MARASLPRSGATGFVESLLDAGHPLLAAKCASAVDLPKRVRERIDRELEVKLPEHLDDLVEVGKAAGPVLLKALVAGSQVEVGQLQTEQRPLIEAIAKIDFEPAIPTLTRMAAQESRLLPDVERVLSDWSVRSRLAKSAHARIKAAL